MKINVADLPQGKTIPHNILRFLLLVLTLTFICFTLIPLCVYQTPASSSSSYPSHSHRKVAYESKPLRLIRKKCDISSGEWIPQTQGPYYTNMTCKHIHDQQNCMLHGRPDTGYLYWRWKPGDCELPRFDARQFLDIVRGKSMAFVGDSVARNQMQSLLCMLSTTVGEPVDVSENSWDGKFKRWLFTDYNFTIATFWSPQLVKAKDTWPKETTGLMHLYVDEPDEAWITKIDKFDYVIISAGQWFWRPLLFYEHGKVVGCHICFDKKMKDLTMYYGYRRAFRTAFKAISKRKEFKGVVFLRTFSTGHFEDGTWKTGGTCPRTKPFKSSEKRLKEFDLEFYLTQMEEYRAAERKARKRGLKLRLLDTTQATLLRPDGHPGPYGHFPQENRIVHDCVHWCLPGPIDTWNEFLLQMLKTDGERSFEERL
ncbi:PREDICTED: protein trichome birefringence-like 19 [Nelumbo nucifera]|uniref:Protein trichome birefringence-like 19 n=2 Tax=Nelumbo nucifera TaxID=4432 RepID=A0A1U8ACZ3_NELNU|nr:PREDICTED: protein trichome birefringence-like 19 [Nelumbo nucifera]DAD31623.1 TPA_asm: hypothetical protein HUJ06_010474 [Nelumbo nucifera]